MLCMFLVHTILTVYIRDIFIFILLYSLRVSNSRKINQSFDTFSCVSAATATSVTTGVLSKMDPQQVAKLLKARGANDKAVAAFLDNNITGKIIVNGLSDDDLKEMNFTSGIQRRGIMGILELIIANGWFLFFP